MLFDVEAVRARHVAIRLNRDIEAAMDNIGAGAAAVRAGFENIEMGT
jgi:hypothetical protein